MVTVDVVLPVLNEQAVLDRSVRLVRDQLQSLDVPFRITIVDNASTDDTLRLAARLAEAFDEVTVLHTPTRGKGHAIALGWTDSEADVLVFMDIDLAVDLAAIEPLIAPLLLDPAAPGASDLCVGSRYVDGAVVRRGLRRTLVSQVYRRLVRLVLGSHATDPPCGFKAIRRTVSDELLPLVADTHWFFDTELLVLAERRGYRIVEIPVTWTESSDSRVGVVHVALADLAGIARMTWQRLAHRSA